MQAGATSLLVLASVPTFMPVLTLARAGGPPLASATPAPSTAEAAPCPATGPSPNLRCDTEVLLTVRDRLRNERGDRLQTWQPDMGIGHFAGVLLGDDPRRVVGLEIVGERPISSLAFRMGYVPWQLSRLPRLERLVLRENWMYGSIPSRNWASSPGCRRWI